MSEYGPYKDFKTGKEAVDAQPKTGTSVVIVGAGIGGLSCAIELMLNGHGPVTVFDSVPKFMRLGDTIGVMGNAGKILSAWPQLYERLDPTCGHSRGIDIRRFDGKWLTEQKPPPLTSQEQAEEEEKMRRKSPLFDAHRGDLHQILLDYAKEIGVDVRQGVMVSSYDETDKDAAVIVNGERIAADLVIAADGVKSKAREVVLGFDDEAKPTGYSIFRAFFSKDVFKDKPEIAHLVEGGDRRTVWIGPDIHFICSGVNTEFSWVCTHKDHGKVAENWTTEGEIEDALKCVEGWDPVVRALVAATPKHHVLDWPLYFRPPLPTWTSKGGRIALLGDAAHPFLPTSIQGASQAIEDGATIAKTLLLSKGSIKTATKVYEELRYKRVKETQLIGFQVRERWHRITDWENIDPEKVKLPHDPALFAHDARVYAVENYDATVAKVKENESKGLTTAEALRMAEEDMQTQEGNAAGPPPVIAAAA